jgi:hypothetical protein
MVNVNVNVNTWINLYLQTSFEIFPDSSRLSPHDFLPDILFFIQFRSCKTNRVANCLPFLSVRYIETGKWLYQPAMKSQSSQIRLQRNRT